MQHNVHGQPQQNKRRQSKLIGAGAEMAHKISNHLSNEIKHLFMFLLVHRPEEIIT